MGTIVGGSKQSAPRRDHMGGARRYACVGLLLAVVIAGVLLPSMAVGAVKVEAGSFGKPGSGGGELANNSRDVAVNHSGAGPAVPGDVYVLDNGNFRILQFRPTQASADFVRAFGYDVVASGEHNTGFNEVQKLSLKAPNGGKFRLQYEGTGTGAAGTGSWSSGATTISVTGVSQGLFAPGQIINSATAGIQEGTEVTGCAPSCVAPTSVTISKATTAASGGTTNRQIRGYGLPYNASAAEVEAALNGLSTIGGAGGAVAVSRTEVSPTEIDFTITFGGAFAGNDAGPISDVTALGLSGAGKAATASVAVPGGGPEICEPGNSTPGDVCKQGVALGVAGALNNQLRGFAVDEATGNVFVADENNQRITVFGGDGQFQGAFGWSVNASNPQETLQFCTAVTGCKVGTQGAGNGQFQSMLPPAVTPGGNLVVPARLNTQARVDEFALTLNSGDEVTNVGFVRRFGWDVKVGGVTGFEVCLPSDSCKAGVAGGGPGQFGASVVGAEVDGGGNIYVLEAPASCDIVTPCRVQHFDPSSLAVTDFAPAHLTRTSGTDRATQIGLDPVTDHVFTVRATSDGLRLYEYGTAGGEIGEVAPPLTADPLQGATALAVQSNERAYVLQAQLNRVAIVGPTPPPEDVLMHEPVSGVSSTGATFEGEFTIPSPGGAGFDTRYRFEYFSADDGWTPAPNASGVDAGNTAGTQVVELHVDDLDPNTKYTVRLRVCISDCVFSPPIDFETQTEPPAVALTFSDEVTQTAATIGARINPRGEPTSYHFEWTSEAAFVASGGEYDFRSPAFERSVGAGSEAINVSERITGLVSEGRYRFRVVASHGTEVTVGPGQTFEVLNECGLINDRCFELVSPPDQGASGESGTPLGSQEALQVQASPDGSRLAFEALFGLPGSTAGGEVTYLASRQGGSWTSKQLSGPTPEPSWVPSGNAEASFVVYMSEDLECGFLSSRQPLTTDVPTASIEAGAANLYRINPDNSHILITKLAPSNSLSLAKAPFTIIGASPDCDRVYFRTKYQYPGVAFSGLPGDSSGDGLYEWSESTESIRTPGIVPGPSGDVLATPAIAGAGKSLSGGDKIFDWRNAASEDASQLVFTAKREVAAGPAGSAEVGKNALFARSDGVTTDISASETTNPNQGAFYQYASANGDKVFFLANYELTAAQSNGQNDAVCSGSGTQCDLYEYDSAKPVGGRLTNLTATTADGNLAGAVVAGVLDASDDGSRVYFAAQGQLVPDQGSTYAENIAGSKSFNVYLRDGDGLTYVATLPAADITGANARYPGILSSPKEFIAITEWASRATPSGSHLVFQTTGNVTGYESGGVLEAYLFSVGTGEVMCISCRRDGAPSEGISPASGLPPARPLPSRRNMSLEVTTNYHFPRRSISADGSMVFFNSPDALASGAVDGNTNVYEWDEGQIALVATWATNSVGSLGAQFMGASEDGRSLFVSTAQRLSLEDPDERKSIFVARTGIPQWVAPSVGPSCDSLSESCRRPQDLVPAPLAPTSSAFVGPGNEKPGQQKKGKKKKKRSKGKKKKSSKGTKKKQGQRQQQRGSNQEWRAGK